MSARRKARGGSFAPSTPGGIPAELLDQLHPLWSDLDAIRSHRKFGQYVSEVESVFAMAGGRPPRAVVYWRIATPWLLANGFTDDRDPNMTDLHKFNAAAGLGR